MYKFINKTTKDQFLNITNFNENKIMQTDKYKWEITDKYKNKWLIIFNPNVEQFNVFNEDEPFWVQFYFKEQNIEILQATIKNRKLKSERFLKKFSELAMLISCYYQFDCLKLI